MAKEFKETTVGKIIDRFTNTGEIGTMNHSISGGSIALLTVAVVVAGVTILLIKKYFFK